MIEILILTQSEWESRSNEISKIKESIQKAGLVAVKLKEGNVRIVKNFYENFSPSFEYEMSVEKFADYLIQLKMRKDAEQEKL